MTYRHSMGLSKKPVGIGRQEKEVITGNPGPWRLTRQRHIMPQTMYDVKHFFRTKEQFVEKPSTSEPTGVTINVSALSITAFLPKL